MVEGAAPALVCINTSMLHDVLTDPAWAEPLTLEDRGGLTPLFWRHILPYGEVRLDVAKRLTLGGDDSSSGTRGVI
jgi:Tn3 transposase DDE domain-containing protein